MARTNSAAVEAILGDDYKPGRNLTPFIAAGNETTSNWATLASGNGSVVRSSTLVIVEGWLAAYFYTLSDPTYTSKSELGASGAFLRGKDNPYKEGALAMDPTGYLKAVLENNVARATWGGKPPSEQIDYVDRS